MKPRISICTAFALTCAAACAFALPPLPGTGADPTANGPVKRSPAGPSNPASQLPGGNYTLRLTLNQKVVEEAVVLAYNGNALTATLQGGEALSGSINSSGQLTLQGSGGGSELRLNAPVANGGATGSAQLAQAGQRKTGSFTLEPVRALNAKELPVFVPKTAAPPPDPCGFFCKLGKCLSDWSKC